MEDRENIYDISFSLLRFVIRLEKGGNLPKDKESAIRGAILNVLYDRYCDSDRNCDSCDHRDDCMAHGIKFPKYKIEPYFKSESIGNVLECENKNRDFRLGDRIQFRILLFGQGIDNAGIWISAARKAGKLGLGKEHLTYILEYVYDRHDRPVYKDGVFKKEEIVPECLSDYIYERKRVIGRPDRLDIRFISPVTIKFQKKFVQLLTADAIIESMARRIYSLNCYVGNSIEYPYVLVEELPDQGYESSWKMSVRRYSEPKRKLMTMKGLKGRIELYNGDDRILNLIIACELTHIGKNASFGFGKYEIS